MDKGVQPVCRQNSLVVQELAGEILIYDLKANKAVCLNETSALILTCATAQKPRRR
jgi:hypothetical protein